MLENAINALLRPGRVLWTGMLTAILLVGLGVRYADFAAHQRQGFQWCLENPDACDGREILLPVWDVVAVEPDSYTVFKVTGPIPIAGDPAGLTVGDTVSIRGVFRKEQKAIVETHRTLHSRRPLKKALSGTGLLLFFVGLPFCLRIRNKRLVL
jgi:hypothetical protein